MERMDWHEYEADDDCLKKAWRFVWIALAVFIVFEVLVIVWSLWFVIPVVLSAAVMIYALFRTSKC